jgi:hypothetical protein
MEWKMAALGFTYTLRVSLDISVPVAYGGKAISGAVLKSCPRKEGCLFSNYGRSSDIFSPSILPCFCEMRVTSPLDQSAHLSQHRHKAQPCREHSEEQRFSLFQQDENHDNDSFLDHTWLRLFQTLFLIGP